MCKDGKCQERAGQIRNTIISLGTAAREMAKLENHPYMVVKTSLYIAFVLADPGLHTAPGLVVIMEVYPTNDDAEIARKADRYMIEDSRRSVPQLVRVLEQLFGIPPASNTSDTSRDDDESRTIRLV